MTTRVEMTAKVRIYEVNSEQTGIHGPSLVVQSHPIDEDQVVIRFPGAPRAGDDEEAARYTVVASDMRLAIDRCSRR